MKTIKIAISIDEQTYRAVERLTKKLHMSRSEFFTQAARNLVEKEGTLELPKETDPGFGGVPAAYREGTVVRIVPGKGPARRRLVEKW